ncbi:MAG: ThiF family adenylyltransferase [Planctomycetia bacterium]|nr:MAG: ThiF family adenylyltransferase [Planctomycetia bacterium]
MSADPALDAALARYSRQMLFAPLGEQGQRHLRHARVLLVGCGALGTVLASTLVRAGVGFLRVVDRDFIELDNLQRQVLFDEHDIAANLPKAEAAARKLRRANSAVEVEAVVADAGPHNVAALAEGVDLLLDGTDNFETRFLLNDLAVRDGLPWVYGACIAAEGLVMAVLPGRTPCLRCIWDAPPPAGETPTCDTAGVLAAAVNITASLQALEAIKILSGRTDALHGRMISFDAWLGRFRALDMQPARETGDCRCCVHREFPYLAGDRASRAVLLCGRNAVQVTPPADAAPIELKRVAARLGRDARAVQNEFLLRFAADSFQVTLFADGRAIVKGTADAGVARSVVAKYVGA